MNLCRHLGSEILHTWMNFKAWLESLPDVSDDHFLDEPSDEIQVTFSKIRPQRKKISNNSPFIHGEVKPKKRNLGLGYYGTEQH
jgi:hypothetical protein